MKLAKILVLMMLGVKIEYCRASDRHIIIKRIEDAQFKTYRAKQDEATAMLNLLLLEYWKDGLIPEEVYLGLNGFHPEA